MRSEQQRSVVPSSMDNVEHIYTLDWIAHRPVENLVIAMRAMPHATMFISWDERKAERHGSKAITFIHQFGEEAYRAVRIFAGNIITNGFKIGFRIRG